jgi:hypothetical protein
VTVVLVAGTASCRKSSVASSQSTKAPAVPAKVIKFLPGGPQDLFEDGAVGQSVVGEPNQRVPSCAEDPASTAADWKEFRRAHPFHAQTLAISKAHGDGCRTLVLSEPRPGLTVEQLISVDPTRLQQGHIEQHPIGFDGWVKDAVFVVPPMTVPERRQLVSSLHIKLYGTSYKANLEPLAPVRSAKKPALNVAVTPAELQNWLLDPGSVFSAVEGGEKDKSGDALLHQTDHGVYASPDAALVAWVLPQNAGLSEEYRVEAREFFLDSDLLIGAISGPRAVVVLGRQRALDTNVMPPLRFETVQMLAATSNPELAQSYQRLNLFAGPVEHGKEWAPILLSPELVDTEYGSLLNITDQILKGWSNAGQTKYTRFDYPVPKDWKFKRPVPKLLEANQLTYNWNTKGAGASVHVDDLDIFWLRSTGALNVTYLIDDEEPEAADPSDLPNDPSSSYLGSRSRLLSFTPTLPTVPGLTRLRPKLRSSAPGAQPLVAEPPPPPDTIGTTDSAAHARELAATAHLGFASSGDALLARVVEYNALYQIFKHFKLGSGAAQQANKTQVDPNAPITERLVGPARDLLQRIERSTEADLRRNVASEIRASAAMLLQSLLDRKEELRELIAFFPGSRDRMLDEIRGNVAERYEAQFTNTLRQIKEQLATLEPSDRDTLSRVLVGARMPMSGAVTALRKQIVDELSLVQRFADLPEVERAFAGSVTATPDTWIHTPSIVVSWNQQEMVMSDGGHNLDSTIGEIRVERAELSGVTLELKGPRTSELRTAPRAPRVALGLEQSEMAPVRSASIMGPSDVPPTAQLDAQAGWRAVRPKSRPTPAATGISIERSDSGFVMTFGDGQQVIEASSLPDVINVLERHHPGSSEHVTVELKHFSSDEARLLNESMDLRQRARVAGVLNYDANIAGRRLNFGAVEAFEPKFKTFSDGAVEASVALKVPVAGAEPFWFRIKLFFKNLAPARFSQLAGEIQAAISRVLTRFQGEAIAFDVAQDIRQELLQLLPSDGGHLEIRLRSEASDVTIVRAEPEEQDAGRKGLPV